MLSGKSERCSRTRTFRTSVWLFRWALATATSCRSLVVMAFCAARANRSVGWLVISAAATSSFGVLAVLARSTISSTAAASPPIIRCSRLSISSGMSELSAWALTMG